MNKIMFVGECGAGKRSLIRALSGGSFEPRRAMSVEFLGPFIHAPGEFLENRNFHSALITASAHAHIIVFLQDSTRRSCAIPPGFAAMFPKKTLGLMTKADHKDANLVRAARFLRFAGLEEIWDVSAISGQGLESLRAFFV